MPLVEARTYAERIFQIITLDRLEEDECRAAILKPIQMDNCPVSFDEDGIREIIRLTNGYPYFIQFFCKEIYDMYLQQIKVGIENPVISQDDIMRKLDADFYSGRWSRVTDRQRDLLLVIARLPNANKEFTVKDISEKSTATLPKPFQPAQINNILLKLIDLGLIYKNRRGRYSFAVPLLADYINRQEKENM